MNDTDVAARLAEALRRDPSLLRSHQHADALAAALLPVVREIADQRAAEEAAEATRLRAAVARVEAAAEGLEYWRANAERYGDDVADADSTAQQKAYSRMHAYERSVAAIRRALDGEATDG